MKAFKPRPLALAAATAAAFALASPASAAPQFTIDLSAIDGDTSNPHRTGEYFSGVSSELLKATGNTHSGSGWLQIDSLTIYGSSSGSVAKFGPDTTNPGLFVTFNLTSTLTSGTINQPNSHYQLNTLDFVVWVDPGKDNLFTAANVGPGTQTQATVTDSSSNDYVLGFGTLISGTAELTPSEGGVGARLNSYNNFAVCSGDGVADFGGENITSTLCTNDKGINFFINPKPFYSIAVTQFNNTGQGIKVDGDYAAITSASGGVDFNRVPTPGALALLGIGLLGLTTVRHGAVRKE